MLVYWFTHWSINPCLDRSIDWLTDWLCFYWLIDDLSDRLIDWLILHWVIVRLIVRLIDWLINFGLVWFTFSCYRLVSWLTIFVSAGSDILVIRNGKSTKTFSSFSPQQCWNRKPWRTSWNRRIFPVWNQRRAQRLGWSDTPPWWNCAA